MSMFPPTDWPLVVSAQRSPRHRRSDALSTLCAAYWPPIYAFLRRRGYDPGEAEDLTQGFFAHLLATRLLDTARPQRGRLRTLLLTCLMNYVANERNQQRAKKRGGPPPAPRREIAGTDPFEPRDEMTPERHYERQWAIALLGRVLGELRAESLRTGKDRMFETLKDHLAGDATAAGYREAAATLNMSEGALRVAVHRMRARYRDLLRREIARTVGDPAQEVDDEIRYLFSVMQDAGRSALTR